MRTSVILCLAAAVLAPGACSDEPVREAPDPPGETPAGDEAAPALEGRTFERHLVLLSAADDTLLAIPWLLSARVRPGGVDRSARGLVLHGTEWETVFEDDWTDPPTPVPWRVLPRGGMRILVGPGDALERIVYEDGVRQVELALGGTLTEWSGPRGGSYRLLEGSALLAGRAFDGVVLDVSRSAGPDDPVHGDWAFLVSGDSLQVVLHSPRRAAPGSGAWRGWARLDFRILRWPVLTLEWPEVRAYERARRDVPVAWRVSSPGDEVTGDLEAGGVRIEAGEGEGPQLPVWGLFGVRGTLTVEGGAYPVVGLLRHTQG